MKFLLLSDIHGMSQTPIARMDDMNEAFKHKFSYVCEYAKNNNLIILQAGDLTHKPRDWHLLNDIIKILRKYNVGLNCVFGQHDMYMRNMHSVPTIMGTLKNTGLINILNGKKNNYYIENKLPIFSIGLFGASFGDKIPKPLRKYDTNILVLHKNISQKELYPKHNYTSPEYFIKYNPGWDLILVGDIHRKFVVEYKQTLMINTGPMMRYEATKYNFKHKPCFFIYDSSSHTFEEIIIPHAPSKLILNRDHIEKGKEENILFEQLANSIEKINNNIGDKINIKKEILTLIKEVKNIRTKRLLMEIIKYEE